MSQGEDCLPCETDSCCEVIQVVIDGISQSELLLWNIQFWPGKGCSSEVIELGGEAIGRISTNIAERDRDIKAYLASSLAHSFSLKSSDLMDVIHPSTLPSTPPSSARTLP